MDRIDVKDQPALGFSRTFSLTVIGIRYRIFRSIVTMVVVVVAIAFLMNILSESLIKRAVISRTQGRIADLRQSAFWGGRLTNPGSPEDIVLRLAVANEDSPIYQEVLSMGGVSAADMPAFRQQCAEAARYLDFLNGLDYGRRRRLIHNAIGTERLDLLDQPSEYERFAKELGTMKSVRLPGTLDDLKAFLATWPELRRKVMAIREARAVAITQVAQSLGNRTLLEALAGADGAFGDVLRKAGFALSERTGEVVAHQATQVLQSRFLEGSVLEPALRKAVAGHTNAVPQEVNVQSLWRLLRNRGDAEWYLAQLKANNLAVGDLDADRLVELADLQRESLALTRVAHLGGDVGGGVMGIGERMTWLVFVSMLVCVVGIANAMLMSVTERFREIATLKCLGALDTSIMLMCVLEACMLGVIGGVAGSIIGAIIGFARLRVAYGGLATASVPFVQLLASMGLSVVVGIILAAIAALYPSFKAARLAPMEAMRIE